MKPTKNRAAQQLGRLGGTANTEAQNAARAKNAQRAGRPRRVCIYCREPVIGGHVDRRLDSPDHCGAHGWRWQHHTAEERPTTDPDPELLADVLAVLEDVPQLRRSRLLARVRRAVAAIT